jgi:hypothetical protein
MTALCLRGFAARRTWLAVAFSLSCLTARAFAADPIPINLDQARILKLPDRATTVVIGDPLIADLSIQPGGIAVVTGKGYGATNLIVMDKAGGVLMEKTVEVMGPIDPVVVVYRGVTRQTYSCTPDCAPRITLGDTGKDFFDRDTGQYVDYFKNTLDQTQTRDTQAAAAGSGVPH